MDRRLSRWCTRVAALTVKELIQLSRDGFLLLAIVYLFTVDIWMSGHVHLELHHGNVVVYDGDGSALSRELIYRFRPPHFWLERELLDVREGIPMLDAGDSLLLLEIPPHFQRDLLEGVPPEVQIMVDGSNTVLGTLASSYAAQIIMEYATEVLIQRLGIAMDDIQGVPMVVNHSRAWYNPNQDDAWFLTISELLTVITILSLMLPAAASVREKERGTIEQLLVAPLTPAQIMISKVSSMTLVILFGTAVSLFGVIMGIFHVPVKGNLPLFFLTVSLYTVAVSGLGLFIATFTRNIAQVAMFVLMVAMPVVLLSGAWTPLEAMPPWLRSAVHLSPLYYFIEMCYGILLRGAGLSVLWDSLLWLSLLGSTAFLVGVRRFRRQFT